MVSPVQVFEGDGRSRKEPEQLTVELWQLNDEYCLTGERVMVFESEYDLLPANPDQRIAVLGREHDLVRIEAWNMDKMHLVNLIGAVRLPDGSIGYDKANKVIPVIDRLMPGPNPINPEILEQLENGR